MINVAVINIRDIFKNILKLAIIIILLILIYTYFSSSKTNKKEIEVNIDKSFFSFPSISSQTILDSTFPSFLHNIDSEKEEKAGFSIAEILLGSEYKLMDNLKEYIPKEQINPNELTPDDVYELAKTGLETQVVEENNVQTKYNIEYGDVKIKNETDYNLTEEMLTPNLEYNKQNILIFNTHTCESYTSSEKYPYEATGNYRTTDLNYTVTRVGKQLADDLRVYGFNVIQDSTYHDYPAYSGSYTRSLETVTTILNNNTRSRCSFRCA